MNARLKKQKKKKRNHFSVLHNPEQSTSRSFTYFISQRPTLWPECFYKNVLSLSPPFQFRLKGDNTKSKSGGMGLLERQYGRMEAGRDRNVTTDPYEVKFYTDYWWKGKLRWKQSQPRRSLLTFAASDPKVCVDSASYQAGTVPYIYLSLLGTKAGCCVTSDEASR
jgi:hypothetical protein